MFDFAWSEIMLIGVVALIAIGPKDMPAAIKSVSEVIRKARRMAGEFQSHLDEMMRDANLHEVRDQLNEIRNFDLRGEVERTVDPDGSLRSTFASNPLEPAAPASLSVAARESYTIERPAEIAAEAPAAPAVPDFIPPEVAAEAAAPPPPSFIPPDQARIPPRPGAARG